MIHFWFLRHGNTLPLTTGGNDLLRKLSDKGIQQAMKVYDSLREISFNAIFCSPAERAKSTTGYSLGRKSCGMIVLNELYPTGEDLDAMFTDHGYAPLGAYFNDPRCQCLHESGEKAAKAILEYCTKDKGGNYNVLIVGHAVVLPAVAYKLADLGVYPNSSKDSQLTKCLEVNLDEAQYFKISTSYQN